MNCTNKLYKGGYLVNLFVYFITFISCKTEPKTTYNKLPLNKQLEKSYLTQLTNAKIHLDSILLTNDTSKAQYYYLKARKAFKQAEPILAYIDINNYNTLNAPNILKVEEEDLTNIREKKPIGFQVIEEEVYADKVDLKTVKKHSQKTSNRLELLIQNTDISFIKEYHVLWIVRETIIRIGLTGITGFDSPVLENSLEEASLNFSTIKQILNVYKNSFTNQDLFNDWITSINETTKLLNADFNSFDRYSFLKNSTQEQLKLWNKTVNDWGVEFPFTMAFNNDIVSLFSKNTYNITYFSGEKEKVSNATKTAKIELGKALFNDANFSKANNISCATCHLPNKGYTDGLKIAKGVSRNSPTLLYAALQRGFFYDKSVGNLEGQIVSVINNEKEFHSNLHEMESVINENSSYSEQFNIAYSNGVSQFNARNAIATFVRTLIPFNSKFDRNMNGIENSLTVREKNGFNLFTGKAKCATCHFTPIFNGTVPVKYTETELEAIGVPAKNDTINANISPDLGRYNVFQTENRKHFFKTPTVRNVELTAPYMHNGVFNTLEEVIDFYNRGGGQGIGIDLPLQTLPPDPLNLTMKEQEDLVLFLKTLTDKQPDNY